MACSVARSEENKPPDETFDRSPFELKFQVPDSFTLKAAIVNTSRPTPDQPLAWTPSGSTTAILS